MKDLDERLEQALGRWGFTGSRPDWDDVVERARERQRVDLRRLGTVLAAAAAVVLAAPALAVIGALRGDEPRPLVVATLEGAGAGSGQFEAWAPHTVFVSRNDAFVPVGRLVRRPFQLRWSFDVEDTGRIGEARLVRGPGTRHGSTIVRLCGPCVARDSGRAILTRAELTAALNGAEVVVRTRQGELRGRVRPNRR